MNELRDAAEHLTALSRIYDETVRHPVGAEGEAHGARTEAAISKQELLSHLLHMKKLVNRLEKRLV